jgi:hypothetical protein
VKHELIVSVVTESEDALNILTTSTVKSNSPPVHKSHFHSKVPQRTASPFHSPPISTMDPDETMTISTPSTPHDEGYEEDTTFNDDETSTLSNGPQTPANDHLNAAAPGELSPPRSQQSPSEEPPTSTFAQTSNMANGTATRSSGRFGDQQDRHETSAFGHGGGGTATDKERENADAPGYGWKNKKAQEEMSRAWEYVVDQDFSVKEFGDVTMLSKGK